MKRRLEFLFVVLLTLGLPLAAQALPATTIVNNGDPAHRVDIVLLGDGYTSSEMGQWANDAQQVASNLFVQEPYYDYQHYYNVHRIDVVSQDSGVSHPELGIYKNTALGAYYDCSGIVRLICVNVSTVMSIVNDSLPANQHDIVLVIVNDTTYGGSGGTVAVASLNSSSTELVLHELGHSFGLLADEYAYTPPTCNNTVEPAEPNATKASTRGTIKWNSWIDSSTPIPTTTTTPSVPGLYTSAKYCSTGLYRPTYNTKMRTLGKPFDQINSEQLIKRIYSAIGSSIDSADPANSNLTMTPGTSQTFSVSTPEPMSQPLQVVWDLDGQQVAAGSSYVLDTTGMAQGTHTVQAVVSDPTSMVRNDPEQLLVDTQQWSVNVGSSFPDLLVSAVSNPPSSLQAGGSFSVTDTVTNQGSGGAAASVTSYYLSTNLVWGSNDILLSGSQSVGALAAGASFTSSVTTTVPSSLSAGTYYLFACADSTHVVSESNESNNCQVSSTPVSVTAPPQGGGGKCHGKKPC